MPQHQDEDLADGRLLGAGLCQWQVRLDLVTVAAALFLFHHMDGLGQVDTPTRSPPRP